MSGQTKVIIQGKEMKDVSITQHVNSISNMITLTWLSPKAQCHEGGRAGREERQAPVQGGGLGVSARSQSGPFRV